MALLSRTWSVYPSARGSLRSAAIDVGSHTFKAVLLSDSYTPGSLGATQRSDVAAYALGTDQTVSLSNSSGVVSIGSAVSWSGSLSPRYVAVYDDTHANDALVCVADLGGVNGAGSFTLPAQVLFTFDELTVGGSGPISVTPSVATLTMTGYVPGVSAGGATPDLLNVDFDGYASTAELIGDTATWNVVEDNTTSEIALVTAPAGSGYSKAMQYHYNHGSNGCTSITIRRKLDFPTPQQEVWAEFGIRWSANFTTTQTACLPNDHKLIFGDTVAGLNGRWAFHVGADNPPHTLKVATPHRTVGSSYEPGTGIIGSYYPNQSGGLVATDIWETDTWHTIRLHYRSTTTNAVMQVWYDGTLIHDESGFGVGDIDGSPDLIEGFSFCHNKDDGPDDSRDMYIWWSHIKAWSTDPGWSS